MPDPHHNLLKDEIFTVSGPGGGSLRSATLPELFTALTAGEAIEFAALQPYQAHAWHAFLAQLGALAAFHEDAASVSEIAGCAAWADALRALTDARDEPWCLVVPDLAIPAFMQPPVPEGSLAKWNPKNRTAAPDAIDLLETAKNHDVKAERIVAARPEHWVYALVSLQTMQGFSGRDNYGIARMNGGVSNRPAFAVARDLAWSTRFARDADLLLSLRNRMAADWGFNAETGCALPWLEPWDGVEQLGISELDPFFIEICRRIRLIDNNGRIVARWTTTKAIRIAAEEQKGNLGDPWIPVRIKDGAALTAGGLSYRLVQRVLFGREFQCSAASVPQPGDGDEPLLLCQVLVRGQGKTDGYHERFIPVPPKNRKWLATGDGRQRLGEIEEVESRALKPAIAALLQGGPQKLNYREPFDREIDRVFFAQLFADIELPFEEARLKWLECLLEFARSTLDFAKQSAPVPSARLFRASAAADRIFNGAARELLRKAGKPDTNIRGDTDESPTA